MALSEKRQALRAGGLGASEVPSIFGQGFGTPTDVWLDRMGLGRGRSSSPAMSAGSALEIPILRLASSRLGVRLTHNRQTFAHPRYPEVPLFATPDAFGPRRSVVGEVKLVGYRWADWKDGPATYAVLQVQSQLACLPNAESGILIALLGSDLRTYRVERDPVTIAEIEVRAADWWQRHIVEERAPEPLDSDDDWTFLRATTPGTDRRERVATPDEQVAGAELLTLTAQIAAAEARADELKRLLARDASDSDVLGLGWAARWSSRSSTSWKDVATAAGATDDLIAANTRPSVSFAFRVQKEGQRG